MSVRPLVDEMSEIVGMLMAAVFGTVIGCALGFLAAQPILWVLHRTGAW